MRPDPAQREQRDHAGVQRDHDGDARDHVADERDNPRGAAQAAQYIDRLHPQIELNSVQPGRAHVYSSMTLPPSSVATSVRASEPRRTARIRFPDES